MKWWSINLRWNSNSIWFTPSCPLTCSNNTTAVNQNHNLVGIGCNVIADEHKRFQFVRLFFGVFVFQRLLFQLAPRLEEFVDVTGNDLWSSNWITWTMRAVVDGTYFPEGFVMSLIKMVIVGYHCEFKGTVSRFSCVGVNLTKLTAFEKRI